MATAECKKETKHPDQKYYKTHILEKASNWSGWENQLHQYELKLQAFERLRMQKMDFKYIPVTSSEWNYLNSA